MNWIGLTGFGFVILSAILMASLAFLRRKSTPVFREIPAFARLQKAIGLAVEEGSRLHISLGRGGLTTPQSAAELAGLEMLHRVAELTSASDRPPVATSGDGAVAILSQDALQASDQAVLSTGHDVTAARLAGLTPFSYAAGTLLVMRDEKVSANILIGNFGIEVALLTDAAERENSSSLAASDNLPAQAILYASAQDPLIGEELFAAGAYVKARPFHTASLIVQDSLRWLVVIAILVGAILKLAGLL
ncbi:MAG: hypothetical protein Q8N45_05235 [Anaerolineales bacterium]|nr:hypothetical protein [Anaerolineales bacterium]MDP2975599.1 hypothetical protein [Anaerolineales bacterium]